MLEMQISKNRVGAFAVGTEGRSGGLGIFWNNYINFNVLDYSKYHIDASA
jgi:hypothetical protein